MLKKLGVFYANWIEILKGFPGGLDKASVIA